MNFLRKTICFTKISTFMNLFGHWAQSVQSFVLLCSSAGPSKRQPMCPEVVCDEKQIFSNVSRKRCFFIIVYGLWSEKFALSEKNNCLGIKNSVLCIQRNVLGKTFLYQKDFFSKISRILREKFSNFCEVVSSKVVVIPFYFCWGRFQGKYSQKSFFSLFPDLEQKIDYWKNIKMNVKTLFYESGGVFLGKTFFLKLFDLFFLVFPAKNCKF